MATAMESPLVYPESPLDPDDAAYPCKGCGQILEEGKAFELAGNRWHIDCFRCNTCGTLLDSDANLLLLGDGSLICNNCTYSCSSCGNKIEDLAILTGDQAFCANCFKCRNCKRKIENLRYARTSQGIFCMDCHEALMARRRKKTGRTPGQRTKHSSSAGVQLDKSLPAIPPPEARKTAFMSDTDTGFPDSFFTPPVEAPSVSRTVSELQRDSDSRPSTSEQNTPREGLTLPSTTFRNNNRHSTISQRSNMSGGEEFLIPLAFDPTPPSAQSPAMASQAVPRTVEEKPRDYFTNRAGSSQVQQSVSQSKTSSPHIAYQEKGRQSSRDLVDPIRTSRDESGSRSGSAAASPYVSGERNSRQPADGSPNVSQIARTDVLPGDKFKLQDAPKNKRSTVSRRSSESEASTARADGNSDPTLQTSTSRARHVQAPDSSSGNDYSTPLVSQHSSPDQESMDDSPRPPQTQASLLLQNLPKRGDSLESAKRTQTIPRKELHASATIPEAVTDAINSATTSAKANNVPSDLTKANGGKVISAPLGSPDSKSIFDTPSLSQQTDISGRLLPDSLVDPRAPPRPPANHARSRNESISTMQSDSNKLGDGQKSPGLLRYSAGGDFTMDEDMARILGQEDGLQHESFLRRVSNSVRHGRSYSDKATGRLSRDRWPRPMHASGASVGQEMSSPNSASPENRDDLAYFKNELRRERQRNVEREKRIAELEAQLDSNANIKKANSELKEKRSTMVVLDTQKEIVVRELEVLTEHLAAAKNSGEPFDVGKMSNTVLREFAESLEKLKRSFAPQIEESIQRRNDLIEEIAKLNQMKDKSFAEFEQLSSKNAQLAELNNQLVHQIQNLYKANPAPAVETPKSHMNGLGIYSHHKDKSQVSIDSREARTFISDASIGDPGTTLQAGEAEPITVLQGPHVVNIRKGQPKKFDWRKGQKVAKGVTKGLKGAFTSTQQSYARETQFVETPPYHMLQAGPEPTVGNPPKTHQEASKQSGFGFFGNQKAGSKSNGLYTSQNSASTPSLILDASTNLFGSDLEQRAEFEKAAVPYIVRRCIEEVESRGMDVEGIYRKPGASTQVQQVREGFERTVSDYDISDPDIDIASVASAIKQYLRRLPNSLIPYELYDKFLETGSVSDKDARIEAMQKIFEQLPRTYYETLEYLTHHLNTVASHHKENLMTTWNLAVVFAPTIMRPEDISREITDVKVKSEIIMCLIEECEKIFTD